MTEYQTVTADETVYRDGTIKLHGAEGFAGMRAAGRLAAEFLMNWSIMSGPASPLHTSTISSAR